jgi:hypothetical protein
MIKKIILFFSVIVIFVLIIEFYFQGEVKEQKIDNIMDQVKLTFDSNLKQNKMDDLKIALLLSNNTGLIDALENDDEDRAYNLLSAIVKSIKKSTNISIRAQIITKELNILARSWDDIYAGMPLSDYRYDLKYFQDRKTPRTSLEIGRRLGIKATVPIYKNNKFLGFVEVISFFKSTTEFLASIGVDLYVLLDLKDTDSAVLMRENLVIDNYVVANLDYNYNHIQTLNSIDFSKLQRLKVIHKDKKYIFYENMFDGELHPIGKFVFVLPQNYLEYFRNPEDDVSYLINVTRSSLYDVTKQEKYENTIYDEYQASKLIHLQAGIAKEDQQEFLDKAYKKLDKFSKDELIQMMLHENISKKIDGKIQ